ncbi:hypothetical protein HBH51_117630 [Parastagonospora nodorum]|nr:hypothetical protein HBH51_117630 [Parastagonospora nodorum]KAH4107928.1 hypothetical protein HBH46_052890 [Parastagonospora nodorum]KAH4915241.1 hypothetical protein HBI79_237680 [Parastagonospora nodorum]KAH5256684.1 hypothetical protein HBI71_128470 [Parastagonospora nodorum]KAH6228345.1 hypothetical protein HBI53_044510 [Parastagonospora nodorum]
MPRESDSLQADKLSAGRLTQTRAAIPKQGYIAFSLPRACQAHYLSALHYSGLISECVDGVPYLISIGCNLALLPMVNTSLFVLRYYTLRFWKEAKLRHVLIKLCDGLSHTMLSSNVWTLFCVCEEFRGTKVEHDYGGLRCM